MHDAVPNPALRASAIDVLLRLRQLDLQKKPGLSELLDWVHYLQAARINPKDVSAVPFPGALIKQHGDQLKVSRLVAGE